MKKKNWRAVIFDMDGVLINSEPHHKVIERGMFEELNIPVSEEEHKQFMGMASDEMWSALIERYELSWSKEDLLQKNNEHIISYFDEHRDEFLIPGVADFLKYLKENGIDISVASSSSSEVIDHLLDVVGIGSYFDIRVGGQMVEKSKPEPEIYLYTARLMEVNPEDCLVIEDSTNGIRSAKAAGMYCVAYRGVGYGGQDQSSADLVIEDFSELEGDVI